MILQYEHASFHESCNASDDGFAAYNYLRLIRVAAAPVIAADKAFALASPFRFPFIRGYEIVIKALASPGQVLHR